MNRQQRRKAQREREAYNRLMNSAQQKRREELANNIEIELYYTAFGLAINEVYGWKKEPTLKLWEATDKWIGKVAQKELTVKEMKEELMRRSGVVCAFE